MKKKKEWNWLQANCLFKSINLFKKKMRWECNVSSNKSFIIAKVTSFKEISGLRFGSLVYEIYWITVLARM